MVLGGLIGGIVLALFIALIRGLYGATKKKFRSDQRWIDAQKAWNQ